MDDRPDAPCPHCGEIVRKVEIETGDECVIGIFEGRRLRQKLQGFQGWVVDSLNRIKHSKAGRLAREWLRIDRSDPAKTVKAHRVDEKQDDGTWATVHDHQDEAPAKTKREGN